MTETTFSSALFLAITLLLSTIVGGCGNGDNSITLPTDVLVDAPLQAPTLNSLSVPRFDERHARENFYHEQTQRSIGVSGGSLVLDDDTLGHLSIEHNIPTKALTERKLISLEMISDGASWFYFHFEPHGLVFAQPVELKLALAALKETKEEDLVLYYYHEDIGRWIRETQGVFSDNREEVIFKLKHFSYYFFARR